MNKHERKEKMNHEFRALQQKLFRRTAFVLFMAITVVFILTLLGSGRVANFTVSILNVFFRDYNRSVWIYDRVFREYMDIYILMGVFAVFLIGLRVYFNAFTKYFNEVDRGIDALMDEHSGEVVLSPELVATEKKINHIKHTLEKQKMAAEAAEQRKNDLVVYLAHDLKTPLSSVIGYLTLLRDEGQISEELREKYLSISLEKAEHLEDLINEFFEITRFNLSNITLERSKVNLTRMMEQLIYEFKPMLLEKNLECELETAPNMMITFDANKMQRVFDNLLRNAVNYSFEDSTIRISVTQMEHDLHIKFTNRGNTIPREKLERIFEQFYRLDTSRSSRSGGAGLGLAIAKEIVELHDGTITAKSENETVEFVVIIPCS